MADILSEMVEGAIPNPLTQEIGEDEDTDAVVMPDHFARIRPLLCQPSGEPRLIVRAAPYLVLFVWAGFLAMIKLVFLELMADDPSMDTPLMYMMITLFSVAFAGPGFFTVLLYHAIKPGGPLEQLGAGEKCVSAQQLRALERAAWVPKVAGFCSLLVPLGPLSGTVKMALTLLGSDLFADDPFLQAMSTNTIVLFMCFFPLMGLNCGLGFASAAAWYYTLKVAVCLARDDVTECVKQTTRKSLAEDESWAELVARPAIRLGTETMKHLSAGWGRGTGFACLLCWAVSFANFVALIHHLWQNASPLCEVPGRCKFRDENYNVRQ